MSLVGFLIAALVLLIVLYVISLIIGMLKLPGNIVQIIWLIIAVFVILWILSQFGLLGSSSGSLRLR